MINTWSYSRLLDFEKCPYKAKLKYGDKIPEPQNEFAARGVMLHDNAEAYTRGELPELHEQLNEFSDEFKRLRELYAEGKVSIEEEWAHDKDWNPCAWKGEATWLRLKLDFLYRASLTQATVIDLKSGKKFGNEIKHAGQGMLYTVSTFLREPKVMQVSVEFWYPDVGELTHVIYQRQHMMKLLHDFDRRGKAMTTADRFPAKPSIFNCKWCAYRPEDFGGTGDCKFCTPVFNLPVKSMPQRNRRG